MILDEATSALDNKTEKEVILALDNLMRDKTVIFISHRLSGLSFVDRVVALDKGKIIAEGTYRDLLKKKQDFRI